MRFSWEKLGKLFDPSEHRGRSWMHEFAQSPSAIVFDNFVRVFFCTRPEPQNNLYLSYMAFVDLDRLDLTRIIDVCKRPLLPLGGLGTFDEFGTNPISVIRYRNELRVYFAGWTRCESVPFNGAIGVAVSRDGGCTFTRLGSGPVLSYSPDEPFLLGSPRIRRFGDRWCLWYVSGKQWLVVNGKTEPVYKIRMAVSSDGINWEKHGKDLLCDKLGELECQACPDVIFRDGLYHMFFSYREVSDYKVGRGGYRIGYAWSADMFAWHRDDDLAGMAVSETGWDSQMVNYPHVFELDGKVYMLYQGNEMGRTGMGLARLVAPAVWGAQ